MDNFLYLILLSYKVMLIKASVLKGNLEDLIVDISEVVRIFSGIE